MNFQGININLNYFRLKSHIKTMHNQDKDSKSQMTIETENEALHVS